MLDLTRLLPGGYATLLLADLGADVVKIEEPHRGDYIRFSSPPAGEHSAAHVALNRNKRSVTLNLKHDDGRRLLLRLAGAFDVLVESFRPGVMDRLGIGYDTLHRRHPGLVYCAVTGYGQTGPRAQSAGHDVNYIGYAGLASLTGAEGQRPVIPGVQVADLGGGGMAAVIAILTALHRRAATGEGCMCDVSMMDGALSWLSIHAAAFFATNIIPERELMPLSGGYPCYRIYRAADGYVTVGALEPQFWAALCEAIGREDLAGDAFATGARRDEVIAELDELFSGRTRAQWMELLGGRDVCVGPVNDLGEALEDEQVRSRNMVFDADVDGAGPWRHVGNPIRFAGLDEVARSPAPPRLGEHTAEVLAEIGVDAAELESLRAAGAL